MARQQKENITIFGGGLVGALTALFLGREGYAVEVFEKRPDYRTWESSGRSINLALSDRGWKALQNAQVVDRVKPIALPMRGRMMHDREGNLTFQPYGKEGQAIFSVSRAKLNAALIEAAEELSDVNFYFESECTGLDLRDMSATIRNAESETHTIHPEILLGTDGAFSIVRRAMQYLPHFNFKQEYIEHDYKELTIPPTAEGEFALEAEALHIWPRGQFMLIALPNPDKSFTATLFLSAQAEEISFVSLKDQKTVQNFFEEYFPDVIPLIPNLLDEFFENPTSGLLTTQCSKWTTQGRVGILGDAAHAIVPFYGQGMNAGFEDAQVLKEILETNQHDWSKALPAFEKARKANADAISELALRNFIEMRDHVADDDFLLRKKIEAHLHEEYPNQWMPLYSMVTFSHIPYAEALRIGDEQKALMTRVMKNLNGHRDNWKSLDFSKLIAEAPTLPPL